MVYQPEQFIEDDPDAIYSLIEDYPLGVLITSGSDGIVANLIPFTLDRDFDEHGRLLTHVARNNPVWHDHDPDAQALIVFQGVDRYISPNWYPTKQITHETVPTWNYTMVQVRGELIVHDDPKWVRGQAGRLTKKMEATEPVPWKMADAPQKYLDDMFAQTVGLEVPIRSIIGKFKNSQNRPDIDVVGVIETLRARGSEVDLRMADHVERQRGKRGKRQ